MFRGESARLKVWTFSWGYNWPGNIRETAATRSALSLCPKKDLITRAVHPRLSEKDRRAKGPRIFAIKFPWERLGRSTWSACSSCDACRTGTKDGGGGKTARHQLVENTSTKLKRIRRAIGRKGKGAESSCGADKTHNDDEELVIARRGGRWSGYLREAPRPTPCKKP